jgi:hypothetical protein
MTTRVLIKDESVARELVARRKALGHDLYDEMWEGVYVVVPAGDLKHGRAQALLLIALGQQTQRLGLVTLGPVNIGEASNYRIPDVAVVQTAGGLDDVYLPTALIVAEVRSPGDDTYEKFGFYHAHGVQEIIVALPAAEQVELWARNPASVGATPDADDNPYFRTEASSVLHLEGCLAWLESALGWRA